MAKVTKHTRAGQDGKVISCPNCQQKTRVHHFSWFAVQCQKCKKMIEKTKWNISENQNY
jgi:ribosomal protein S27E